MKRFVILILALLCVPCFGQTVINRSGAIHGEPYVSPYDSLSNFHKFKHDDHEDYYHLVGQTALYIGEPYSGKTNPSLSVGSEYKIIDVLPDEKWNSALCYLKVKNTKTGKIIRVEPGLLDHLNISWVVKGYMEKLYSLYSESEYTCVGSNTYSHSNADYLINCKTNTINKNIPNGSIWKFVEIRVLPRMKNDNMDLDDRCPIVFVLENSDYGRYYAYYEDSNGNGATGPFRTIFKRILKPIDLSNLNITVGMTEAECRAQLGEPISTGISVSITNGKTKRNSVLVFPNNIHVTIENGIVSDIEYR